MVYAKLCWSYGEVTFTRRNRLPPEIAVESVTVTVRRSVPVSDTVLSDPMGTVLARAYPIYRFPGRGKSLLWDPLQFRRSPCFRSRPGAIRSEFASVDR